MGHWEDGDKHEMWGEVFHDRVWVEDEEDEEDDNCRCRICNVGRRMGETGKCLGVPKFAHEYCEDCYSDMKYDITNLVETWEGKYNAWQDEIATLMADVIENEF